MSPIYVKYDSLFINISCCVLEFIFALKHEESRISIDRNSLCPFTTFTTFTYFIIKAPALAANSFFYLLFTAIVSYIFLWLYMICALHLNKKEFLVKFSKCMCIGMVFRAQNLIHSHLDLIDLSSLATSDESNAKHCCRRAKTYSTIRCVFLLCKVSIQRVFHAVYLANFCLIQYFHQYIF